MAVDLSYLGRRSSALDAADFLGDTGFIHDMIHFTVDPYCHHDWEVMVVDPIRRLEEAVPGWFYDPGS